MERQTSDPGNIPLTFEERKAIALEKGFTEDQCFSTHNLDNLGIPTFGDKSQLLAKDDIRVNYYEDKIDMLNRTYGELQQKMIEMKTAVETLHSESSELIMSFLNKEILERDLLMRHHNLFYKDNNSEEQQVTGGWLDVKFNTDIEKTQVCVGDNINLESPIFKSGVSLIAEERQRQIEEEGWNEKHDDYQVEEELAFAAATYATPNGSRVYLHSGKPNTWLWEKEWWKPTPDNRIKELVKAGALIAAEIDRLNRKLTK